MTDLLHEALNRHAAQKTPLPNIGSLNLSPSSAAAVFGNSSSGSGGDTSDDELIPVQTPAPTAPGTPLPSSAATTPTASRSSSPTRAGSGGTLSRPRSGAGKPRRDKTKENAKAAQNKNPGDIFVRFPGEVLGRILGELGQGDLLSVGLVNKKWRRSMTLNYTWYLLLQKATYVSPSSDSPLPQWKRSDSKVDWAARYASILRRDDIGLDESSEEEEETANEQKWREEAEEAERKLGKEEMRQAYKSMGNSKVKGKTGKGAARTWEGDDLGGGGNDYI